MSMSSEGSTAATILRIPSCRYTHSYLTLAVQIALSAGQVWPGLGPADLVEDTTTLTVGRVTRHHLHQRKIGWRRFVDRGRDFFAGPPRSSFFSLGDRGSTNSLTQQLHEPVLRRACAQQGVVGCEHSVPPSTAAGGTENHKSMLTTSTHTPPYLLSFQRSDRAKVPRSADNTSSSVRLRSVSISASRSTQLLPGAWASGYADRTKVDPRPKLLAPDAGTGRISASIKYPPKPSPLLAPLLTKNRLRSYFCPGHRSKVELRRSPVTRSMVRSNRAMSYISTCSMGHAT